jgi:hypothetical protein
MRICQRGHENYCGTGDGAKERSDAENRTYCCQIDCSDPGQVARFDIYLSDHDALSF